MAKTFIFLITVSSALGSSTLLPEIFVTRIADPVLVGAGDIANCSRTQDEATGNLLDSIAGTVVTLGDNAYPDGTLTQFNNCYSQAWGRFKNRTRPSPGNHDYHTPGSSGYYTYFGPAASPQDVNCTSNCKGYYSYNLGAWHVITLNSEIDHSTGSVQVQWLRADLAANASKCTLAYWHRPRFSSGKHGNNAGFQPFWQALYDYGADVVLNAHDHTYERFAPQNPSGQADPNRGIREFVVGTGGAALYSFPTVQPNSEVRNNTTWGVLKLTLHPSSYEWKFIPIAGQTFTDSGSANCIDAGSDLIFADGFESGNLSVWSSSTTDSGDLNVHGAAALVGSKGLRVMIDDNNPIYVTDDRPNAERRYRARFYFDPNSISMANGDAHFLFNGYNGTSRRVLRVEFHRSSGNYQIRAGLLNDGTAWSQTNRFTISNGAHFIELDWRAATGAGANNGGLTLWIDGTLRSNLTGVDNDTRRIDRIRLGAVATIDAGTRGTCYFDAFESRRQTYIGPAASLSALTISSIYLPRYSGFR